MRRRCWARISSMLALPKFTPHSDRYACCWVSDVNKHLKQDLAKYAEEARHMNGENSKKAKELAELHCQLATNMGHQNQKQKIRYMVIKKTHYDLLIYMFRPKSSKSCRKQKSNSPARIVSWRRLNAKLKRSLMISTRWRASSDSTRKRLFKKRKNIQFTYTAIYTVTHIVNKNHMTKTKRSFTFKPDFIWFELV